MKTNQVTVTRPDGTTYIATRLECGCYDKCDPYAHDTAWDWDGRPDPPEWDDLSREEQEANRTNPSSRFYRWEDVP